MSPTPATAISVEDVELERAVTAPTSRPSAPQHSPSSPPASDRSRPGGWEAPPGAAEALVPPQPAPTVTAAPAPAGPGTPRVSVVIPTFNEARNLPHVLAHLPQDVHEVIVVDGNSVDGTVDVARSLRADVTIVRQNRMGKGNALACGFAAATGEVVVVLDADGSADPREIPRFVAALVAGADVATGSRFAGGATPEGVWGDRWLTRLANVLFGTAYTDLRHGYHAFWRHSLDRLALDPQADSGNRLWGDGFEVETIISARAAKAGLRITEVPSHHHPRAPGGSALDTWRDGGRVVRALLVERISGSARSGRGPSDPTGAASVPAGLADGREPRSA